MKLYDSYPDHVEVNGQQYQVHTDFRAWIRFYDAVVGMEDSESRVMKMLALFSGGVPDDIEAGIKALCQFYAGGESGKKDTDDEDAPKHQEKLLYDFAYDADYFIAAFKECYNISLMTVRYMHWWEFLALFRGLNANTELKQRIQLRGIDTRNIKDRKEKARIRQAQMSIAIPSAEMDDEMIGDVFSSFF